MAYKLENTGQIIQSLNEKIKTADDLVQQLSDSNKHLLKVDTNQRETKKLIEEITSKQKLINDEISDFFNKQQASLDHFYRHLEEKTNNLKDSQNSNIEKMIKTMSEIDSRLNEQLQDVKNSVLIHNDEIHKKNLKHIDLIEQKIMNQVLQMQVDIDRKITSISNFMEKIKNELGISQEIISNKIKSSNLLSVIGFAIIFVGLLIIIL